MVGLPSIGSTSNLSLKSTTSKSNKKDKAASMKSLQDQMTETHLSDATPLEVPPEELAPSAGDVESESGKFRQLLSLLKRCIGVKDLAAQRFSLPAHLCEPIGNLECWMYCERADFFAAMGDGEDEFERMLAVLRWTFTKDLRFVKHKIAKPYNSVLGEFFRCHFDTEPISIHPTSGHPEVTAHLDENPTPEVLVAAGRSTAPPLPVISARPPPHTTTSGLPQGSVASSAASTQTASTSGYAPSESTRATSLEVTPEGEGMVPATSTRVVFLNEQTSHHPPISYFYLESRGPKGVVTAMGADQLSAKFTGTSVKVFPGPHNRGIFVNLPERKEEYQISHPTATVAGLLRGSPYATIGEYTYITCRSPTSKRKLRCIISYIDESWIMKPRFLLEGVIYEYDEGTESEEYTKIKHVPEGKVVATLEGCWRGEIRWKMAKATTSTVLLDLVPLNVIPKQVAPLEEQHEQETRRVWAAVSEALHSKEWAAASKAKQAVEQAQRNKAEERKKNNETYIPNYFEAPTEEWDGRPVLTESGKAIVEKEFKATYAASPRRTLSD